MNEAEQFFYDHAGSSYDPATETYEEGHIRGARELAEAEAWLKMQEDLEVVWEDDWSVGDHTQEFDCYEDGGPSTCEMVAIVRVIPAHECSTCQHDHGPVREGLASLHCIDDADDNYRRVVVAELAMEARES